MKSYSEIVFSTGGVLLMIFDLLLMLGQIYCVIKVFSQKQNPLLRVLAAVQLVMGLIWFCQMLDGSFYVEYYDRQRDYLALTKWIYSSPWLAAAAVEAAFAVILCLSLIAASRYQRSHLSQNAVKETVDMLPVGICFSKEDGTAVLKNLLADELCCELTGESLTDAEAFWRAIDEAAEKQNDVRIVVLKSGKAMMCQKSEITVDEVMYFQLIACDISEQYRIIAELREKNQKLLELQERMKAFGKMASRLAMTEEILRARVSVHDEMGHLLLSGKYYLDRPETGDREKLLQMERFTHLLLMREGEEPDGALPDSMENALTSAMEMGVEVSVSGDIPTDPQLRDILAAAVRECAANTAKHASGDSLSVAVSRDEGMVTAVLRGSGRITGEPIIERGGLLNLRQAIEAAGGDMTVTQEPAVTLKLTLPEQ